MTSRLDQMSHSCLNNRLKCIFNKEQQFLIILLLDSPRESDRQNPLAIYPLKIRFTICY